MPVLSSAAANAALMDDKLAAHVAASDPHGDRSYADTQVATRQRKIVYDVHDYGVVGDGVTDDYAALQALVTDVAMNGGGTLVFKAGDYLFSDTLQMGGNHLIYEGGKDVVLRHTGTGNAIEFNAGTGDYTQLQFDNFHVEGNANTDIGIYARRQHNLFMKNVVVRNVADAGVVLASVVTGTLENIAVSSLGVAMTTPPVNGIRLEDISGKTTTIQIITPNVDSCTGAGIYIAGAAFCEIVGGTSEANARGIEITSAATGISIHSMDLEANTTDCVLCNGHSCQFYNMDCVEGFGVGVSAFNTQIRGGLFAGITIASGAVRTILEDLTYNFTGTGAFSDSGTFTQYRNLVNGATGLSRTRWLIEDVGLSTDSRNWGWQPSYGEYGDLALMISAARGGDPFAGSPILRVNKAGSLSINGGDPAGGFSVIALPYSAGAPGTPSGGAAMYFVSTLGPRYKGSDGVDRPMSFRTGVSNAMSGGTVTVLDSNVTGNSKIFITVHTPGGTPAFAYVSAREVGLSFTITGGASDTSTFDYILIEP